MTAVLVLRAHGCPPQAIVVACGLDECTVTAWVHRAGGHYAALHSHLVEAGQVEVGHVQADEIRVTGRGGVVWQAMAVALPARLWLGGAARTVFQEPVYTGKRGCPRLTLPDGFLLAQVVKSRQGRRLAEITRRVVVGTEDAVTHVIAATRGGTAINTADIERSPEGTLATFRAHLAPLTRRGRGIAHGTALVESGLWRVGCAYNFCWAHESLRVRASEGAHGGSGRQPWPLGWPLPRGDPGVDQGRDAALSRPAP